jgi:quercetin dioxygenase-like cupin family protein
LEQVHVDPKQRLRRRGDTTISCGVHRARFEPGWRWSEHVKPIAKTDRCEAAHAGYVISGRMKVVMNDGTEDEFGPGDLMIIPPGHDAWVVGDDAMVVVDWTSFGDYATS